jgi:hypothetical protein
MGGYRFRDLGAGDLSATAEYQFQTRYTTSIYLSGTTPGGSPGTAPLESREVRMTYLAPAMPCNFHKPFDYGAGLQYRFDRITSPNGAVSTHNDRAWFSVYGGYTYSLAGPLKPFLAVRYSTALARPSAPGSIGLGATPQSSWNQLARYLEGTQEWSLQAGIRF